MTKTRKTFSRNLKKIRQARGLTQEQLAENLGISVRYVQTLEGKNTPNVKLDTLEVLAKALKVKPTDLLQI
jgi:transcriptional regulator with XRE-family HTH domain